MKIKVIHDTSVNGKSVVAGDVVAVSDGDARLLIGYGLATEAPAAPAAPELTPAEKKALAKEAKQLGVTVEDLIASKIEEPQEEPAALEEIITEVKE